MNILTKVTPKLANLFGLTAMTMLESASEAGQVYKDTKDPNAAEKSFLANMLLVGITNQYDLTGEGTTGVWKLLTYVESEIRTEALKLERHLKSLKNYRKALKQMEKLNSSVG